MPDHSKESATAGTPRSLAWDDLVPDEPVPGVQRQIMDGTHQTVIRYVYAPGAIFPVHAHPQEQITVVVRGQIRFDVAGQRVDLGPGKVAVIPGGVAHGAAVIGTEEVETINALSPRRGDHPGESRSSGHPDGGRS